MNPEIFKILYFVTWIRNDFGEGSHEKMRFLRIHWFHRDGTSTQSCTKNKRLQLRNIRIRLDVALRSLFLSGEKLFAKKCLYI